MFRTLGEGRANCEGFFSNLGQDWCMGRIAKLVHVPVDVRFEVYEFTGTSTAQLHEARDWEFYSQWQKSLWRTTKVVEVNHSLSQVDSGWVWGPSVPSMQLRSSSLVTRTVVFVKNHHSGLNKGNRYNKNCRLLSTGKFIKSHVSILVTFLFVATQLSSHHFCFTCTTTCCRRHPTSVSSCSIPSSAITSFLNSKHFSRRSSLYFVIESSNSLRFPLFLCCRHGWLPIKREHLTSRLYNMPPEYYAVSIAFGDPLSTTFVMLPPLHFSAHSIQSVWASSLISPI